MAVPISQMWTVATYVLRQRLRGRRRYPLVLMLEPLFRCNLACAGCGKIPLTFSNSNYLHISASRQPKNVGRRWCRFPAVSL